MSGYTDLIIAAAELVAEYQSLEQLLVADLKETTPYAQVAGWSSKRSEAVEKARSNIERITKKLENFGK